MHTNTDKHIYIFIPYSRVVRLLLPLVVFLLPPVSSSTKHTDIHIQTDRHTHTHTHRHTHSDRHTHTQTYITHTNTFNLFHSRVVRLLLPLVVLLLPPSLLLGHTHRHTHSDIHTQTDTHTHTDKHNTHIHI